MPLRLVIRDDDRALTFDLGEGEHVIGSCPDCDVRISHPAVSRRHASIEVAGDTARVRDLGSSNGTRLRGRSLDEQGSAIGAGDRLEIGPLLARVEAVDPDDLEAAMTFESLDEDTLDGSTVERERSGGRPPTTASIGSLQGFALERLPELLTRLEEGADAVATSQTVGEALFASLPCLSVELALRSASEDEWGVVYAAEHPVDAPLSSVEENSRGELVAISVRFFHPSQARTYRSLIESGARVVRLAARRAHTARHPVTVAARPPLPEPATVVSSVRRIYDDAARVALGGVSVMIRGESGTGKEVLARYVHQASPRRDCAFVALNCAALPRDLLEAELFGIEQGVATGVQQRPGRFELADGGTLFLDEIGDMAPETQARILRVLQEGCVYRLGAKEPRSAQVRVLAATNRDLDALMRAGAFRTDLFHRIADWTVTLPPLRERRADIPNLAAHFLKREAAARGLRIAGISKAALAALQRYPWPGNIRQLEREMSRAALFVQDGEILQTGHLQQEVVRPARRAPETLKEHLEEAERRAIVDALARHDGNISQTATTLGIGRSTLYRRMKELEVESGADGGGAQDAAPG